MRLTIILTVLSILLLIGLGQGYDSRRAWTPVVLPHYQQQLMPFQPEVHILANSGLKFPSTRAARPNSGKVGVRSIVSSHVHEYPIPPIRPQSRVIVAKMESFGMTNHLPMMVLGDSIEKSEETKESLLNKIEPQVTKVEDVVSPSKMADLKRVLIDVPLEKAAEFELLPIGLIEAVKAAALERFLMPMLPEQVEGLKEMVNEKVAEPSDKINNLKDTVSQKVGDSAGKVETAKNTIADKAADPLEKVEDLKNLVTEKVQDPLDKFERIKEVDAEKANAPDKLGNLKDTASEKLEEASDKIGDVKDSLMEKLTEPIDKIEDLKGMAGEKIAEPLEKLEDVKDLAGQKVTEPLDKVEGVKDLVDEKVTEPLEKIEDLKDLLGGKVTEPLQKIPGVKDLLEEKVTEPLEKLEDLKELADGKDKEQLGKVDELKDLLGDKLSEPLDKVQDLKALAGEKVGEPFEKLDELKDLIGEKVTEPLTKLEDLKDLGGEKVLEPLEKVDGLKDNLKDVVGEKVAEPLEKIEGLKESMDKSPEKDTEVVGKLLDLLEKTEDIKSDTKEKILEPLDKIEDLKNIVPEKPDVPSKVEDVKGLIGDKSEDVLEKLENAKLTIPDKIEDVKDDVAEKVTQPLEKVSELKDTVTAKPVPSGLVKRDNLLDPKLDLKNVVFDALQNSIVGDRKQYFKLALTTMNKGELEDLHEALLHAFNLKGFQLPMGEKAKEDLKDAAHELAATGTDKGKKEALTEIEHVLEPEKKAALKNDSIVKPVESVPGKQAEEGFTTNVLSDKGLADFLNNNAKDLQQGMGTRMRRWGVAPARHYRPLYVYLPQHAHNIGGWGWGRKKRSIYGTGVGTIDQELHSFPPPSSLRLPIKTTFRQINSAAPPDPYVKSKNALSLPQLSMSEPAADKILSDIKEGLRYVIQTKNDWTFAIHGTGTTACHAVLDNLIETGDTVLVLISGYWGELMANMAERLGAHVIRFKKDPGTVFTTEEVEIALNAHKPDIVLAVQGESSTGVYQRLDGIGELCQKYGALLVADVVAVAGIQPVMMDRNKIDAVFFSSHKGLGGVVGLAPVSLSPRAVSKIKARLTPPRAYQTDLTLQAELWNTRNPDRDRVQSLSLPVLYALREALATIVEERMENTLKRHALSQEHLNRGLAALGLEHYVLNPNDRLIGITTVNPPPGKDPKKIANYMFRNYNIEISSGFGPTDGKVLRFAIFASNADVTRVSHLLRALKNAIRSRETSLSY